MAVSASASSTSQCGAGALIDDGTSPEATLSVPCYMGTCGWTDDTLLQCARFYAPGTRTPIARLKQYARTFPCVEIDTSTYAIPRPEQVREWMSVVPPGFKFHIKAFGLFPSRAVTTAALPRTSHTRSTACMECGSCCVSWLAACLVHALCVHAYLSRCRRLARRIFGRSWQS